MNEKQYSWLKAEASLREELEKGYRFPGVETPG
jgi:hypothetical protein